MSLDVLLEHPDIWRGQNVRSPARRGIPTGHASLDPILPGGWPVGGLTELLLGQEGVGELQLLMPALARLSREERWLAWIDPPHTPYVPALAAHGIDLSHLLIIHCPTAQRRLWALEQALRSNDCSAVLSWLPPRLEEKTLRRLQLATEEGGIPAFLFRPLAAQREPSPAALRLRLTAAADSLRIEVLKCRGGWAGHPVELPRHAVA